MKLFQPYVLFLKLQKKKVGHIRIDGGTPQSARQALVTRFQENDNVCAAVVSLLKHCSRLTMLSTNLSVSTSGDNRAS